jgi:hypothetical protein
MNEGLRELGKNLGFYYVSGLPIHKSLILMLANQRNCFFNFKQLNVHALFQCKVFKDAQGNPERLLRNVPYFCYYTLGYKSKLVEAAL